MPRSSQQITRTLEGEELLLQTFEVSGPDPCILYVSSRLREAEKPI